VRTEPLPPPYQVGDRLRFVGHNSFSYGDNPRVEHGDEGVVVENHEGQWGRPDLGKEFAEPLDGWSTLDIKGNKIALHADDNEHFPVRYEQIG
jgi:hypothetical protein